MNFEKEVLQKSFEKPVVVDFWAAWCGPCRILGPVIEQLAEEQQEKWDLVKVDTEQEQELAARYRVMSIPNVKMFYEGEAIAEFAGALPRHSIRQWLEENLPDKRKQQVGRLLEQMENGAEGKETIDQLRQLVADNPDLKEARLALAQHLALKEPETALELVEPITLGNKLYDTAEDIRNLAHFISVDMDDSPAGKALTKAKQALEAGDRETAIQQVIEATAADKSYEGDLPRKVAIALFRLWGNQHPLTKNYRWRFDMALY